MEEHGVKFTYEEDKIKYTIPEHKGTYHPDFKLRNGVTLEMKGRFTSQDRKKMLLVMQQNPDLELIMVFPRPQNTISKVSKTTYAMWCEDHGIPWMSQEQFYEEIKQHASIQPRRQNMEVRKPKRRRSTRTTGHR